MRKPIFKGDRTKPHWPVRLQGLSSRSAAARENFLDVPWHEWWTTLLQRDLLVASLFGFIETKIT